MTAEHSGNLNDVEQARKAALRATKGSGPILVGPWLGGVGFELLYWIPFVRSLVVREAVDPARLVVVTRGGAHAWYQQLGGTRLAMADLLPYEQYRHAVQSEQLNAEPADGGDLDAAILESVRQRVPVAAGNVLHPFLLAHMLRGFWAERDGFKVVEPYLQYQRLDAAAVPEAPGLALPPQFAAVRFRYSPAFPATPENQDFACRTVERLAQRMPVVALLDGGLAADGHPEVDLPAGAGIHRVGDALTPADRLAVQTSVLARAAAFYGALDGFCYVAPFYGVPAVGFYSAPAELERVHLGLAQRVLQQEGYGDLLYAGIDSLPRVALAAPAASGPVRRSRRRPPAAGAVPQPPIAPEAMLDVGDDEPPQPGASGDGVPPLFALVHNPRTAGTTFRMLIQQRNVEHFYESFGDLPAIGAAPQASERATSFLLQGHAPFGIHRYLAREVWYLTFLRHPVDRVVSAYHWFRQRELDQPSGKRLRTQLVTLSLLDCMLRGVWTEFENGQVRRLYGANPAFGHSTRAMLEQAKANLETRFVFVGIQERFTESLEVANRFFSWPNVALERQRVRPQTPIVTPETAKAIVAANELDIELYDYATSLLDRALARAETLSAALDRLRATSPSVP